jgi:hypothetical protein
MDDIALLEFFDSQQGDDWPVLHGSSDVRGGLMRLGGLGITAVAGYLYDLYGRDAWQVAKRMGFPRAVLTALSGYLSASAYQSRLRNLTPAQRKYARLAKLLGALGSATAMTKWDKFRLPHKRHDRYKQERHKNYGKEYY